MPDASTMVLFLVAAMLLFVVPGPVVVYVVTRSVTQGTKAGLVSVAGVHLGSLVHVAAAVAGLSAIVAASAAVFTTVKLVGAAYLVYLGVRTFMGAGDFMEPGFDGTRSLRRTFWQGALVNVLNPKTAIFFLAFVPQFVDPQRGGTTTQIIVLGALFVIAGMLSDGTYAVIGGTVGHRLVAGPTFSTWRRWVAGSIYIGLGTAAALSAPAPAD